MTRLKRINTSELKTNCLLKCLDYLSDVISSFAHNLSLDYVNTKKLTKAKRKKKKIYCFSSIQIYSKNLISLPNGSLLFSSYQNFSFSSSGRYVVRYVNSV